MTDKDRIEGSAKQASGNLKEGLGKLTGNEKLQAEGKADQIEGAVQKKVGDVKSDLKS